jgi:hypothetical protein
MMRRILQSGEMDDRIMRGGGGFLLEWGTGVGLRSGLLISST